MTRSTITLQDQRRTGLSREHSDVRQGVHSNVRLTIPAREALERSGATIIPEPGQLYQLYSVELGATLPSGIVATRIINESHLALRLDIEPEYPGEIGHAYWEQLNFTPCPKCGAPLVWYEAGYVPGYRVCAGRKHHHWQAS